MTDFQNTPALLSQHTLQRAGCPLHYWIGGAAGRSWLVFMHGATMDHRMFNAQVEALAPDYRVLAWDARGHGRSQPMGAGHNANQATQSSSTRRFSRSCELSMGLMLENPKLTSRFSRINMELC